MSLTAREVEDQSPYLFIGESFIDLRRDADFEFFESFHPEAYRAYDAHRLDGLIFDTDLFLDCPGWSVEAVEIGECKALLVAPQ